MNKLLMIVISIGILVIAFSIGYYLVIFLPNREAQIVEQKNQESASRDLQKSIEDKEVLEKKIFECSVAAKEFHEDYIKTIEKGSYWEPKYIYNNDIKKCIYSGGYTEVNFDNWRDNNCGENYNIEKCGYWERFVKNVYTNETIIRAWSDGSSNDAFWNKHRELFK